MTAPNAGASPERRYDLDWLRVLVILFVFFYHVGLIFTNSWAIDNDRTSQALDRALGLSSFLRMPVLFFVAGAGTWFLFRRRSGTAYLRDRFLRLGVPLVTGMLILVPFQDYVLRRYYGDSENSALTIWREFLWEAFPAAHQHWSHLWFIAYLLVFSVVAAPLFIYFRTSAGEALAARAFSQLNRPAGIFFLAIPLILVDWGLRWKWPFGLSFVDDWARVLGFFTLFVYGYLLFGSDQFWRAVDQHKRQMLILGIVSLGFTIVFRLALGPPGEYLFSPTYTVITVFLALNGWLWLVAVLGYARKFLYFENRLLRYSRDAGYPVYLLHHPVLIAVAVVIVPWSMNPLVKFLVISSVALFVTLATYEVLIRRWQVMRLAFGLKSSVVLPSVSLRSRIRRSQEPVTTDEV